MRSVLPLLESLADDAGVREIVESASSRGYFTPDEDDGLRRFFADYLTARAVALATIDELKPVAMHGHKGDEQDSLRAFLIAYVGAGLLVRAGRYLVSDLARHALVRRKLNEPAPKFGIPRRQFASVYRSLTRPLHALYLRSAVQFAERERGRLNELKDETELRDLYEALPAAEDALRMGMPRYLKGRLRYRLYTLRLRQRSAVESALFALMEGSGRVIAELRNPWYRKRVNRVALRQLGEFLQPGDVMVTRHNDAATNLFLPGFWPHAALHIGPASTAAELALRIPDRCASQWRGDLRVLEARKDGVLLRALPDTLAVDAVVVLRPRIARQNVAEVLERALAHEGKLYDFSFDFCRSDRLVCTEVVYRAYHGVAGVTFELQQRAGRMTLAAEDILDMALEGRGFDPVAIFGTPGSRWRLVRGEEAREVLKRSYRSE